MKQVIFLIVFIFSYSAAKADLQSVSLTDSSYHVFDSICDPYYSNSDDISQLDFFKNPENNNATNRELINFFITINRTKNNALKTNNWQTAINLSQILMHAFEPELVKMSKEYKIKEVQLAKLNLENYFATILSGKINTDTTLLNTVSNLSAGAIERLIYDNDNAKLIQQQLIFVLRNSNYKIIK